jgi:hypothetical protein
MFGSSQCTILSFRVASQLLVRSLLFTKLHSRYIVVILARLTTRRLYMLEKLSSATCASAPSSTSPRVAIPKSRYNFSPSSTSLREINHGLHLQATHCGCSLQSLRCLATQLPPCGMSMDSIDGTIQQIGLTKTLSGNPATQPSIQAPADHN